MAWSPRVRNIIRGIAAVIAVLFGVATVISGGRVLLGTDPGYTVFRPLLVYNTAMGFAYVVAGLVLWRRPAAGRLAAGAIFVLNLLVLMAIVVIHRTSGEVAVDSLRAMSLRTVVWLAVFLAASLRGSNAAPRGG